MRVALEYGQPLAGLSRVKPSDEISLAEAECTAKAVKRVRGFRRAWASQRYAKVGRASF